MPTSPDDLAALEAERAAADREYNEALTQAGRQDLIGGGCDCLIPAQPPKEAIEARRRRANDGDHYHTVANPAKGENAGERGLSNKGYRPGRKSQTRRRKK